MANTKSSAARVAVLQRMQRKSIAATAAAATEEPSPIASVIGTCVASATEPSRPAASATARSQSFEVLAILSMPPNTRIKPTREAGSA